MQHLNSPKRAEQIDRALDMLDRIITLIAEEAPETAASPPALTPEQVKRIKLRAPAWKNPEIRATILSLYGEVSARDATDILLTKYGPGKGLSKSSVGRIFIEIAKVKSG